MMANKEELRKKILSGRRSLPIEIVKKKSDAITHSLLSLPLFQSSEKVFMYLPDNRGEVETWNIVHECFRTGKQVWAPRIVGKDLIWHLIDENKLSQMEVNSWGIPEPLPSWTPMEEYATDAVCVVPGVAFDRRGYRIGHGKGFFDRFLRKCHRCIMIGLCYNFQLVPLCPHWKWDVQMDWVITEEHRFRCNASFR